MENTTKSSTRKKSYFNSSNPSKLYKITSNSTSQPWNKAASRPIYPSPSNPSHNSLHNNYQKSSRSTRTRKISSANFSSKQRSMKRTCSSIRGRNSNSKERSIASYVWRGINRGRVMWKRLSRGINWGKKCLKSKERGSQSCKTSRNSTSAYNKASSNRNRSNPKNSNTNSPNTKNNESSVLTTSSDINNSTCSANG